MGQLGLGSAIVSASQDASNARRASDDDLKEWQRENKLASVVTASSTEDSVAARVDAASKMPAEQQAPHFATLIKNYSAGRVTTEDATWARVMLVTGRGASLDAVKAMDDGAAYQAWAKFVGLDTPTPPQ